MVRIETSLQPCSVANARRGVLTAAAASSSANAPTTSTNAGSGKGGHRSPGWRDLLPQRLGWVASDHEAHVREAIVIVHHPARLRKVVAGERLKPVGLLVCLVCRLGLLAARSTAGSDATAALAVPTERVVGDRVAAARPGFPTVPGGACVLLVATLAQSLGSSSPIRSNPGARLGLGFGVVGQVLELGRKLLALALLRLLLAPLSDPCQRRSLQLVSVDA